MANFVKVNSYVTDLANGVHNGCLLADSDFLKLTLSNIQPLPTFTVLGSISDQAAVIADVEANSVETWPFALTNLFDNTAGTITVTGQNATVTATAPMTEYFRYVWLFNSGAAGADDDLIGYWDNGASVLLDTGQVFTCNLDTGTILTVT